MSTNTEPKKSTWLVNTGRMLGAVGAVLLISVPLTWGLSQEIAFQGSGDLETDSRTGL